MQVSKTLLTETQQPRASLEAACQLHPNRRRAAYGSGIFETRQSPPIQTLAQTSVTTLETPPAPIHASNPPRDKKRGGVLFVLVVLSIYACLGVLAFWPLAFGTSQQLFGTSPDSVQAMWYLAWLPHALTSGINPFFSHSMFEPVGINLAQNTEAPLLGLVTVPLSLFMGPIARANLLMVLAMPLSASAAFFVLRKWRVWGPAAALGGLTYGFSAYAIGHGLGHLQFIFLPFPPLIAMTVVSIVRRERSSLRLGAQLGLLAAAQFLCEPEIMASVALVAGWGVLCAAICLPSQVARATRACAKAFGVAFAVAGALLAYPIWMMLIGPQHYTVVLESHYNDLLSIVSPGPLQKVSLGIHLTGIQITDTSEAGAYIGVPLLLIATIFVWRSRRSSRMRIAAATLVAPLLLSLGPHLFVDGRNTHVPLPFLLFAHLPVLDNVVAGRFSLEVEACLAAILAFGVDDYRKARLRTDRRPVQWAAGGAALCTLVLAVFAVTQIPRWPYASQPVQSLPAKIRSAIPSGDPLAITYPYGVWPFVEPMVWQAEDDFRFRLVGGYALHPDPQGGTTIDPNPLTPPDLTVFLERLEAFSPFLRAFNPTLTPQVVNSVLVQSARTTLHKYHVQVVIVDRSATAAGPAIDLFTGSLGRPTVSTQRFLLWTNGLP